MKFLKISKLKMLLVVACTLSVCSSCKKDNAASPTDRKIEALNNDLKSINLKFLAKNASTSKTTNSIQADFYSISLAAPGNQLNRLASDGDVTTPPDPTQPIETGFSFKRFCAVFSADVGGAWAGAWAGGEIGGAVGSIIPGAGTAAGASAGAVAGGVVVGAAASYAASEVIPGTTLSGWVSQLPFAYTPLGEENANDGHNRMLNSMLSSSSAPSPLIFNSVYLTGNEAAVVSNCQNLISSTMSTFSDPTVEKSKSYVLAEVSDNAITTVSNNFFDGLQNLVDPQDVAAFISSYKFYVSNTANLDQAQKETILVALDASEGSLSFWSPLIGH